VTSSRGVPIFPIHFQQHCFQPPIVVLCQSEVMFVNFRVVLPEVFKPPIQLSQNVIQAFDEMSPVVPHPGPTKVLSD